MKYKQTKEQSGEVLRLAIPAMAKHAAPYNPITYAVWYEYIAGTNPELKQSIDRLQGEGRALDGAAIEEIHQAHIEARQSAAFNRLRSGFDGVINELTEYAAELGTQAGRFDRSLGDAGRELGDDTSPAKLGELIHRLMEETRQTRGSVATLETKLAASRHEMERMREELEGAREDALTDPLTGLKNRRGLERALERLYGKDEQSLVGSSLLAVDIDHFKRINDTYGHLFGDKVIRAVAQVMAAMGRERDIVARVGGEEFAMVLPATPLAAAEALAERIRLRVEQGKIRRAGSNESIGGITVSLGVAHQEVAAAFEAFMNRADEALYASKRAGRNRVTVHRYGEVLSETP